MNNSVYPIKISFWALFFALILLAPAVAQDLSQYDLNNDKIINGYDVFELRKCFNASADCNPQADFDGNGVINYQDYRSLVSHYGETLIDPSVTVFAHAAPSTGGVNTTFTFSARVFNSTSDIQSFEWSLEDGRTISGETVSVSFPVPGIHRAEVTATGEDGGTSTAGIAITVFDPATQAPAELGLPPLIGDADQDMEITLADAHRILKHATRLELLPMDDRAAADIDFSGEVTPKDALLVAEAVIDGQSLPSKLLPDVGSPGALITMLSPELLDVEGTFEIEVGNSTYAQSPVRGVRGYASFVVPFDSNTPNSMEIVPGPVEVRLLCDGIVVKTFTLTIDKPEPLPADPTENLKKLLDEFMEILALNEAMVGEELLSLGITGENFDILLGLATVAKVEATNAFLKMQTILESDDGDNLAKLFFMVANANGLSDARTFLQSILQGNTIQNALFSGPMTAKSGCCSGDEILGKLCTAQKIVKAINTTSKVVSVTCDILLASVLIAAAVPADGPVVDTVALATWIGLCAKAELGISAVKIVTDLIAPTDADLNIEASPLSPQKDEPVTIRVMLEVIGYDDLCSLGANKGLAWVKGKLAERAVGELIRRKASLRALFRVFEKFGEKHYARLLKSLENSASLIIGETKIDAAIENLINSLCDRFDGVDLPLDAKGVLQGPSPNEGTLTFLSDGSARYTCPVCTGQQECPASVSFTAKKEICGKTKTSKKVQVNCQVLAQVTITIGDNGSLNDDIYEVRIDGITVLTSSVPVRKTSTTVQLPYEDTWIQMIGRAAPDGIGTYYISFSGASLIGGSAPSGYDLTPGKVKNFLIRPY